MPTNFDTLVAVPNTGTGAVVLTWKLPKLPVITLKVIRENDDNEDETLLATSTGSDFAGSTYTDTPGSPGQYRYKLLLATGLDVLESNPVNVSTLDSVLLTATTSGKQVNLSWGTGVGDVVESVVQRSKNAGVSFQSIRSVPGRVGTTFTETLSSGTSYQYRVRVVLPPATCDAVGQAPILVTNTVTVSV